MTTRDGFTDAHGVTWVRDSEPQARAIDTIPLKDVARLDLKPGDTLVVTLPDVNFGPSARMIQQRILAKLGDRLASDRLLVIPETAKVSVLRTDGHPLAQWELDLLARQDADSEHTSVPAPAAPTELFMLVDHDGDGQPAGMMVLDPTLVDVVTADGRIVGFRYHGALPCPAPSPADPVE